MQLQKTVSKYVKVCAIAKEFLKDMKFCAIAKEFPETVDFVQYIF